MPRLSLQSDNSWDIFARTAINSAMLRLPSAKTRAAHNAEWWVDQNIQDHTVTFSIRFTQEHVFTHTITNTDLIFHHEAERENFIDILLAYMLMAL